MLYHAATGLSCTSESYTIYYSNSPSNHAFVSVCFQTTNLIPLPLLLLGHLGIVEIPVSGEKQKVLVGCHLDENIYMVMENGYFVQANTFVSYERHPDNVQADCTQ